jgi:hypothetical protein
VDGRERERVRLSESRSSLSGDDLVEMRQSLSLRLPAAALSTSPAEYNVNLVRTSDYTNFLPAFFYPVHLRDSYIALRAFNVELATIKENVRHETLGRMRTTWWRDAIDGVYKVTHFCPARLPIDF